MRHRRPVVAVVAAAGAAALVERLVRPWAERWGASDTELVAELPGDDLVVEPAAQVTRAITIDASPSSVWPWLVQLGADRGGFYSYDWLENLFSLGIHSADDVVAAWQERRVGDLVYADREGRGWWYVIDVFPERALVLLMANPNEQRPARRSDPTGFEFSWSFVLQPIGDGSTTRLLVRERAAFGNRAIRVLMTPVGYVSFLMTRKMLLGIKQRAERTGATVAVATAA